MEFIENKELEEKEVKGIFTDMLKYAPSKLCGMLGNVITVPIYTSLFTTEQYGLYTISIAMLSFLCIIFSDWVGLSGLFNNTSYYTNVEHGFNVRYITFI